MSASEYLRTLPEQPEIRALTRAHGALGLGAGETDGLDAALAEAAPETTRADRVALHVETNPDARAALITRIMTAPEDGIGPMGLALVIACLGSHGAMPRVLARVIGHATAGAILVQFDDGVDLADMDCALILDVAYPAPGQMTATVSTALRSEAEARIARGKLHNAGGGIVVVHGGLRGLLRRTGLWLDNGLERLAGAVGEAWLAVSTHISGQMIHAMGRAIEAVDLAAALEHDPDLRAASPGSDRGRKDGAEVGASLAFLAGLAFGGAEWTSARAFAFAGDGHGFDDWTRVPFEPIADPELTTPQPV
ncbi:hypothetical protein [uncultured Jannaschia sp.]|uniref:hypothetical protein n=1 Tax=uncultured Jannaschia sp. TaxID=293347 RepID=UPI00262EAB38|nr:hypothetical protein [uncultured Jannaschia sp.]